MSNLNSLQVSQRILLAQAKQQWVNTMKLTYKDFNPKLWGRSTSYRISHPQAAMIN